MIYADHNATAPLRPQARDAMLAALDIGANPSSVHGPGRAARRVIETARRQVGGAVGASSENIVFTSGGTEANALALLGSAAALGGAATLIVSALEHEAVTQAAGIAGVPVETAYALPTGEIDLEDLGRRLSGWDRTKKGAPVLALMLANNETGVVQPVAEAARLVREAGGYTHCDAVQGLGKISISAALLGVDYLALSAHKAGGPQGVGALWHRPGAPLKPVQVGGGQERSLRSGTENVGGIAGFGAAAEAAIEGLGAYEALQTHRDEMERRLKAEASVVVMGEGGRRLAGTSCFALAGFSSQTQVLALDLAGVAVSAGAACSSGKVRRSIVLSAMGQSDALADCAIRTSFGWTSTPQDFHTVGDAWIAAAKRAVLKETA